MTVKSSIVVLVAAILLAIVFSMLLGIGGCGPMNMEEVEVISKHIDAGNKESSYIVVTDKGTFEVDNGMLINIWNADQLYGELQVGHRYKITTEGKRYENMFLQEFPYITKVEQLP